MSHIEYIHHKNILYKYNVDDKYIDYILYKYKAFYDIMTFYTDNYRDIFDSIKFLSFGDSYIERTAFNCVVSEINRKLFDTIIISKSFKLQDRPCIFKINKQLEYLNNSILDIHSNNYNVDIEIVC